MKSVTANAPMSSFEFPVSKDIVCPPIGQGFDLMGGAALIHAATDKPDPTMLQSMDVTAGDSAVSMVKDNASYTKAVDAQLSFSGSGWGGSVGLSLSESSFSASNTSTITLNFDAFQSRRQVVLDPEMQLSAEAAALFKSDPAQFALKYGDYFVAGYVYGKRCSLAYKMQFDSEDEKNSFSASLSASYSGVDFSASMSSAIQIATTAAKSHSEMTVDSHYAGFNPAKSPKTWDDITPFIAAYDNAQIDQDLVPIRIIVMPWNYLNCVSNAAGVYQNDAFNQLVAMVNSLDFVVRSCDDFVNRSLYAGSYQLKAVQGVRADAEQELEAMSSFLSTVAKTQTQVTSNDVAKYLPVQPLVDRMNFALSNFVVAFKVTLSANDDDCNTFLKDIDGNQISLSGRVFDGSKGVYLSWSLSGNDGWEGTRGTSKNAHVLARTIKQGGLTSNVLAVLDRQAGTLQIWNCGVNQTLDQNDRSAVVTIRGVDNGLACDDPQNHYAINFWGSSGGRTMIASVI
jgi:hypothetical protein